MATWLRSVELRSGAPERTTSFPFSVPSISALDGRTLSLDAPVTFFVGENGSGKSTLLEAVAVAAKSITVGAAQAAADPTLQHARQLARALKLVWSKNPHRGFYMRAEDFFGYAKAVAESRSELQQEIQKIKSEDGLSDLARGLALMPHTGQLRALEASYGEGLDARSHGEAFLHLFNERIVPDGLFLLDEPEAPLSPRRQFALLAIIKDAVENLGAQFVIATHSPILMAFQGARIFGFDDGDVREVVYDEIDHVAFTRDFLADPTLFLRYL